MHSTCLKLRLLSAHSIPSRKPRFPARTLSLTLQGLEYSRSNNSISVSAAHCWRRTAFSLSVSSVITILQIHEGAHTRRIFVATHDRVAAPPRRDNAGCPRPMCLEVQPRPKWLRSE